MSKRFLMIVLAAMLSTNAAFASQFPFPRYPCGPIIHTIPCELNKGSWGCRNYECPPCRDAYCDPRWMIGIKF